MPPDNLIKLSPSDLTFLWDECKRCFYLKYNRGIGRPFGPMPGIFSSIDRLMKDYFNGKSTADLSSELPPGEIKFGEKWVESKPFSLPGHTKSIYLRGKFDTAIAFNDGTFGVVDFKTTQPKPHHIPFYSRQLHAYSYALENAATAKFSLNPITQLGLLVYTPSAIDYIFEKHLAYLGEISWMPIPRQDEVFLKFLDQVLELLELPVPPEASGSCSYCQYRTEARKHGY